MIRFGELVVICAATILATSSVGCGSDDAPSGSTSSMSTDTLYSRLGKRDGIRAALGQIVTKELQDAEVAKFFAEVGMPGHPSADQLIECLTLQLGNAAGGPEKYPGTPNDAKGFQCRSMESAHAGLKIDSATFDKFIAIAGGVLTEAKVADADIATIASVLVSTKGSIVGK